MPFGRHTSGVQRHSVLDGGGSLTPKERRDLGIKPPVKHAIVNCSLIVSPVLPPGEYEQGAELTWHSDSAFCQINLVRVTYLTYYNNFFYFCATSRFPQFFSLVSLE